MNAAQKHRVRNVIAMRRDTDRGRTTPIRSWSNELARHSMVPRAQWSRADWFLVRFALRQLKALGCDGPVWS